MGICALCLQLRVLKRSHLLARAMYEYVLGPSERNPVVMTRRITNTSSAQVREYLLCHDCERRFNDNGERWVLGQVWNRGNFPLLNRLNVAMPYAQLSDATAFSGSAAGIDTAKLGYFAVSVIWRAAIRSWRTPFGGATRKLELGEAEEQARRFLLGETDFPPSFVVMVSVCTSRAALGSFYMPSQLLTRAEGVPVPAYGFQTLGVNFRVLVGEPMPAWLRELCCVQSSRSFIFVRDGETQTFEAFAQLYATSREARGLPSIQH